MSRLLVLMFLLTLLAAPCMAGDAPVDSAEQRENLQQLRQRIAGLQGKMSEAQGARSGLTGQLQETEQEIGKLARRLRVLASRMKRQRQHLDELGALADAQQQALKKQQSILARQVRAAYVMGRQERLKILLNQQDPTLISRVMAYYDYLNRARAERMQVIEKKLQNLRQTRLEIEVEQQKLARLQMKKQQEMVAIEQTQQQRKAVIGKLTAALKGQGKRLQQLRNDEEQLQSLLKGLREALSDISQQMPVQQKFSSLRGKLKWPTRGRIRSRFGSSKIGSLRWDGVMISAPEGREIVAVHYGQVAFADWLRGFGLLMIIDHGNGYMTLYGHNQSLFKEAGDWVESGEPVALVGNSGGQESSGVYFGIRRQGKAVNPAKWCKKVRGRKVG